MNVRSAQFWRAATSKWLPLLFLGLLTFSSHAQIGPPPVIALQPVSLAVLKGTDATFLVGVVSVTQVSYQWYFNGTLISGATASSYTRHNVRNNDAGKYSVVVRNASGSVNSVDALLSLLTPNRPFQIDSCGWTNKAFAMSISGPAATNYVIQASQDLRNWIPISTNDASAGKVVFTDLTATNRTRSFYRVMVQ